MSSILPNLERPECTPKLFADTVRWIEEGSFIRLYSSKSEKIGIVFHLCGKKMEHKEENNSLSKFRVIWLDFRDYERGLDAHRWPKKLQDLGYSPCKCEIAEKILRGEVVSIYIYRRNMNRPSGWASLFNDHI